MLMEVIGGGGILESWRQLMLLLVVTLACHCGFYIWFNETMKVEMAVQG